MVVEKERNDYYPFGARHVRSDCLRNDNRLLYNGKEEQVTGNLKFLDYGWRMHDNTLGRWFGMDQLSECFMNVSPYAYCLGLPMLFVDIDGRAVTKIDGGYSITGEDVIRYWGNLKYLSSGQMSFDNFWDALEKAAGSGNKRFLNLAEDCDIFEAEKVNKDKLFKQCLTLRKVDLVL